MKTLSTMPLGRVVGALLSGIFALATGAAHAGIAVSGGGQANTGHPIAVPPGIAGMAPNLGLSYVDGGINGPVGVGWSVQGISTITRCPATRIPDGTPKNVTFDSADKLCLDGQRLIQTNEVGAADNIAQTNDAQGLGGVNYREFRTEKDSFARVRAYGITGAYTDNGPSYFKVWTKSGQVYEYGTNPNGNANAKVFANGQKKDVVAVWAVSRISDVLGNYMDFKYEQRDVAWGSGPSTGAYVGHEWNIKEIQYTGTASSDPSNKVVFTYVDRASSASPGFDRSEAYQADNKNVSTRILDSIRTYVNSPNPKDLGVGASAVKVRTYKLTYDRGTTTGRSRLTQITECAGAAETACLPPTRMTYTPGGTIDLAPVSNFATGALGIAKLQESTTGNYGVLTGDFDGDGRTDILRWGNNPADNQLFRSTGDGNFEPKSSFNLTSQNLFKTDGCYYAMVADFNGDGKSDILRVAKSSCSPSTNLLFLSRGDDAFDTVTLSTDIKLDQKTATVSSQLKCPTHPGDGGGALTTCPTWYNSDGGSRFYIMDVNGDGIPDIVTSNYPSYSVDLYESFPINDVCTKYSTTPCTRIYTGRYDSAGKFGYLEITSNVAWKSLYSNPFASQAKGNPYWKLPDQVDVDGDGLNDILTQYAGTWRSRGNGNFDGAQITDNSQLCGLPIDFNGDRRSDCLRPDAAPANQMLTLSMGNVNSPALANFSLKNAGDNLYGERMICTRGCFPSGMQDVGAVVADFDGDGREDILRYGPSAMDNGIYLSNGDGSFRTRLAAGLGGLTLPLRSYNGTTSFVLGDFLGNGTMQILHMKDNVSSSGEKNQIYARTAGGVPADVLSTVTSPTGLVSTVGARVSLPNTTRYKPEGDTQQQNSPAVIEVAMPMYLITSTTEAVPGGSITTEYLYKGLKVERGGRGMLGFHEVRRQTPAPDGRAMTVATQYVQKHPYIGVAAVSQTYVDGTVENLGARISQTTYSYCDQNPNSIPSVISTAGTSPPPCATTARVQRPYLYQSLEEGWDLDNGIRLPTVTTTSTYSGLGDPLTIKVETKGTSATGVEQTFTKTTTNTYKVNDLSGEKWALGRLETAKVASTVPNSLPSISTALGTSPHAGETAGSGPPPKPDPMSEDLLSAILQLLLND